MFNMQTNEFAVIIMQIMSGKIRWQEWEDQMARVMARMAFKVAVAVVVKRQLVATPKTVAKSAKHCNGMPHLFVSHVLSCLLSMTMM